MVLQLLLLEAIHEEEKGLIEGDREVKVQSRLVAKDQNVLVLVLEA
jgi:hypothetical protein